jgi:hypothetical protein
MKTEPDSVAHFEALLESWDSLHIQLIYDCLLHCLRSNSGIGFHSMAQGHPLYYISPEGVPFKRNPNDDGPDSNTLYHLMKALSARIYDRSPVLQLRTKGYLVNTWEDFCRIANEGWERFDGRRSVLQIWEE